MQALQNKMVAGVGWNFAEKIISQIINFVITIILLRTLLPNDFGVVVKVTVIVGFLTMLQGIGMSSAIIQKQELDHSTNSTIFWFQLILATVIALLMIVFSNYVAIFYDNQAIQWIFIAFALQIIFNGVFLVPEAILRKNLKFKSLFIINVTSVVMAAIIGIFMAYSGYGYWSLVIKTLTYSCVICVLTFMLSGWKPSLYFDSKRLKPVFGFGIPLLGTNVLNYIQRNIDDFLIGKYLGDFQLGIYNKSYNLLLMPLRNISSPISNVLFPSLSILQDDKQKSARVYLMSCRLIALVSFPMMIGLYFLVDDFVYHILGTQWQAAIPFIKVFSILGIFQSIGTLEGNVFQSQGATGLQFKLSLFTKTILISAVILGLWFTGEAYGIALYYSIASILMLPISFYFISKLLSLPMSEIFYNFLPIICVNTGLAIFLYCCKNFEFFNLEDSGIGSMIMIIVASIFVYILILVLFRIQAFKEFKFLIRTHFLKQGG